MAKTIIALSGWKQSGKDTAADYIINKYGFIKLSIADALKHNTSVQYAIPLEYFYDNELKECKLEKMPASDVSIYKYKEILHVDERGHYYWTPRALLIHEGSCKREVDQDYWVRTLFTHMFAAEQTGHELFTIADLRFTNEIEAFKKHYPEYKLITVRINRFDSPPNEDPTERDLDNYNFDYTIDNKQTEEEFKQSINTIMGYVLNAQKNKTEVK